MRVLALASQSGLERFAGFEVEGLILRGRDAGCGLDALAPNQADGGGIGKTLLRLKDDHRAIGDEVLEMFQQRFAVGAG